MNDWVDWKEWHDSKDAQKKEIETERIIYAGKAISKSGYPCEYKNDSKCLIFQYKGETVRFYPYTGWHTGKTIKDGRGLKNLLKQIKANDGH